MTQRTNEVSTNEKMERDPVCGMNVDPNKAAAKVEHGGKTYYFCAPGCAKRFQQAPEIYLQPAKTQGGPSGLVNLHGTSPKSAAATAPAKEIEAKRARNRVSLKTADTEHRS